MIYSFLKLIVQISVRLFFRKIHVEGRQNLVCREPCILVANHPNTLLDPLVIARIVKQQIYFLANGSLFDTPLKSRLMYALNMIPIYRKQDIEKLGKKIGNRGVFLRCFDFLNHRKMILIFPEGTSFNERTLRDIKTGTARIAFGAESEQNFELGIKIIPIGLNYTDPTHFGGNLYIKIGEPISLKKYQKLYLQNSRQAVRELTLEISQQLENKIVITKNQAQDVFIKKLEEIYKSRLARELNLSISSVKNDFILTQIMVQKFQIFAENSPEKLTELQELVQEFEAILISKKVRYSTLEIVEKTPHILQKMSLDLVKLLVGFPLFLYGFLNNVIPYLIPSKVADKIVREIEFRSSVMLVIGIVMFSVFHGLQTILFYRFTQDTGYTFGYFISLIPSGFFALFYHQIWQSFGEFWRLVRLQKNTSKSRKLFVLQRKIFKILDQIML